VLLVGLGVGLGPRLFGTGPAPLDTEAPAEPVEEPAGEPGTTRTRPADGMLMVHVPGGTFQMGSAEGDPDAEVDEFPQHPVTLDGFWIDHHEVTNTQYRQCAEAGACQAPPEACDYGGFDQAHRADHPVLCVDWYGAAAYCEWAGARLPTEAEWEYAARGPERRIYPWGNTFDGRYLNSCDINCPADWKDGSYDDGYAMTAPVGRNQFGASWCGALDMAGNVWEWVADRYGSYSDAGQVNPVGPATGDGLVRGGGWGSMPSSFRTAQRHEHAPELSDDDIGFRCVVVPGE